MAVQIAQQAPSHRLTGRLFVHPLFDYMLIGGGLSLLVTVIVLVNKNGTALLTSVTLPYFILLSNSAHFAASTVRLYTKPDAYKSRPFVTMGLPLATLLVMTLCVFQADRLGPHLQALYLTWSPYHYAAQAYGLAVMYSYRSGCLLSSGDKIRLWWVSMLPFFYSFLTARGVGLDWIVSTELLSQPLALDARMWLSRILIVLTAVTPLLLFVKIWRSGSGPMPLISLLLLYSNVIWWFVLSHVNAFAWATIFHGIQYLAIVIIFHLKDQLAQPDNRHGILYHTLWFYAACLLLGYGLFNAFPLAFMFAGFGRVESVLLVVATVNIHHFIVDGYIWRLKKTDSNRRVVDSGETAPI